MYLFARLPELNRHAIFFVWLESVFRTERKKWRGAGVQPNDKSEFGGGNPKKVGFLGCAQVCNFGKPGFFQTQGTPPPFWHKRH